MPAGLKEAPNESLKLPKKKKRKILGTTTLAIRHIRFCIKKHKIYMGIPEKSLMKLTKKVEFNQDCLSLVYL